MLPIGTKVKVLDKTVGSARHLSSHYNTAQEQGYAYVVGYENNNYRKDYIINTSAEQDGAGDYFRKSDVVAYEDPLSSAQEL